MSSQRGGGHLSADTDSFADDSAYMNFLSLKTCLPEILTLFTPRLPSRRKPLEIQAHLPLRFRI